MKYQSLYEVIINISKVILGPNIILKAILGKQELSYNNLDEI